MIKLKINNLQLDNISNNPDSPYKVNIFKISNSEEGSKRRKKDDQKKNNEDEENLESLNEDNDLPIIHFLIELKSELEEKDLSKKSRDNKYDYQNINKNENDDDNLK